MRSLTAYLRKYRKFQKDIVLVYHPTEDSKWGVKHKYLSEDYAPQLPYNHRTMLDNEIVIEYDDQDPKVNAEYTTKICQRLTKDGFVFAKWFSGGKSQHVHILVDLGEVKNVSLLKSCFIRYYSKDLPTPDLQLTHNNHLIRAEYGIHERTFQNKKLLWKDPRYPLLNKIPQPVWDLYSKEKYALIKRRITTETQDLSEHELVKFISDSTNVREVVKDGRERLMWLLIHVLKKKMDKETLSQFMQDWYRYSGGIKLRPDQVHNKVLYQYGKDYTVTVNTIQRWCEEIGLDTTKVSLSSDTE